MYHITSSAHSAGTSTTTTAATTITAAAITKPIGDHVGHNRWTRCGQQGRPGRDCDDEDGLE
jgi:hypothetical protein